jgi:hypothetical protein
MHDLGCKARVSHGSEHASGLETHTTVYVGVPEVSQERLLHRSAGFGADRGRTFANAAPDQGGIGRQNSVHKGIRLLSHPGR